MIDALDSLVPFLLAISLASERLITILKTAVPWLAEEQKTDAKEVDLQRDKSRRLIVQGTAIAASLATVMLVFNTVNPMQRVPIGGNQYSILVLAILGSGGSAFWNNILGYTKALKDVKTVEKAANNLEYQARASDLGVTAYDGGVVALKDREKVAEKARVAVSALTSAGQPALKGVR